MGLDQYLTGKQYVSTYDYDPKHVEFQNVIKQTITELNQKQGTPAVGLPISGIEYKIIQWRKSNQIHKWFVDNVQEGNDNCGEYYVTREQLAELRDLCKIVLGNKNNPEKIQSLLPPQSGFFFGNTEINDWYFEDIKITEQALSEYLETDCDLDLYYSSSW
jgi:hypothetical protein